MSARPPTAGAVVAAAAMHTRAGETHAQVCELIDESPLVVDVAGVGRYTLMWTPTAADRDAAGFVPHDGWLGDAPSSALSLAAGFAFSEGMLDSLADIESIARCPDSPGVVRLVLTPAARERAGAAAAQERTVRSSCGACGSDDIEHLLRGIRVVRAATTLSPAALQSLVAEMQQRQALWQATGGAHAALVFAPDGEPLAFAEDLGRHNALDKAIGRCLLDGLALEGGGVVLSSRLSFEMVAKAARAGLAIVAGVSAASALAVRTAQACGITLCGFVRDGRATVYANPRRIAAAADAADAARPGDAEVRAARDQPRSAASESRTASGSGSACAG
ncbi:MAG: formate dehydrogenase accessory sulfurtransferase FdhD [Burkholderiales bacterium]|nr:MAG: formate dehydrogenase accessory sulfurtransferase FdhD [Burkholderiales bacterium]